MSTVASTETETLSFVESEELFHEHAMRATGLSDFGDPSYRQGMRVALKSEAALNKHHAENPQHKHGKHPYSSRKTGMTERQIREAFGPYLERYYPSRLK